MIWIELGGPVFPPAFFPIPAVSCPGRRGRQGASKQEPSKPVQLLEELKREISDWPAKQAKIALELIVALVEGNEKEFKRLYPELTFGQLQTVTAHLKKLENLDE